MWNKKSVFTAVLKNAAKAVSAIVLAAALILLLGRQIEKIGASIVEAQILTAVLEKRAETISKIKKDFEIIGEAGKSVEAAVPGVENILGFVAALESLETKTGLKQSFRFEPPAAGASGLQTIGYAVSVEGSLPAIVNYLENFEKLPYFTNISGFSLSAGAGGLETGGLLSFRSRLYVR